MTRPSTISWLVAMAGILLWPKPGAPQVPDSIIRRLMDDYSVPGLTMAVVQRDSLSLYGWGVASESPQDQVTPDTPFRIASVAKSLVASTVLTVARSRGIDLHADVQPLIGFSLGEPASEPITLHHLLTHTAGFDERMVGYAARSSQEMRPLGEYLADRMPDRGWLPGDIVSYSNHGMSLAAYAVEKASGQSFADAASSALFTPLGMTSTMFIEGGSDIPSPAAQPLECQEGVCRAKPHLFSHTYPAGLAFSTARDMGHFIQAVLNAQQNGSPLADLIPTRFTHNLRLPGMSYGFFNQTFQGRRVIAHSGSAGGYWSLLLMVPEEGVGFFVAANGGSSRFGAIAREGLLPLLLDQASEEPLAPDRTEDPSVRAGRYELTRYSHRTIERIPQLFHNSILLTAKGDTLLVYSGGGGDPFLQVGDSLYQGIENGELLAFGTRQGDPYLFRSSDVYGAKLPAAYEKRSLTQGSHFLNEYLSWVMGLPLILMVILWPILVGVDAYLRRRQGQPGLLFSFRSLSATLSMTAALGLFSWFVFGFIAQSNRLLESGEMLYGMPPSMTKLLWIPYAHLALTVVLAALVPKIWKRGWWGLSRRAVFCVLVVGLVLQAGFLVQWNYLPASW